MSCQPRSLGGIPGVWAYICLTENLDCGGIAALTATGSPFPCHFHPWTQAPSPAQEAHFLAPGELIALGLGLKSTIVSGGRGGGQSDSAYIVPEPIMLRNVLKMVAFLLEEGVRTRCACSQVTHTYM